MRLIFSSDQPATTLVRHGPVSHLRLVSTIRVSSIFPVITARGRGIVVGDAHMSDDQWVRFRVIGLDPVTVRLIPDDSLPAHQAAIEAWISEHRSLAI